MLGKHVLELVVVAFRQVRVRANEERRRIIFNPCREFVELTIDAVEQNYAAMAWMVIFFFASAAASSAYLTVSETFPLEVRALAIAFFYAVGTGIGGVAGPWFFGALIDTGSRWSVFGGYLLGSVLMLAAALIAARFGVAAERKPLESVSRLLAAAE
jgi:MFS family permease